MSLVEELELSDQIFQGAFERGDYPKALAAVIQCKRLAEALFHSDSCDGLCFTRFHDRWEYYREMEREIKTMLRQSRRAERGGFLSRFSG